MPNSKYRNKLKTWHAIAPNILWTVLLDSIVGMYYNIVPQNLGI